MDNLFDQFYYQSSCGPVYERSPHWTTFFGNIADHIVKKIGPTTVLDAGCAMGFLVESLRDRGVQAYGIDISDYAIANVREDMKPYCWVGSILEPLPQKYDLIISIEVLEHLQLNDSEKAIENLCCASNRVLFSSTPLDFREATHFNVQPIEYWTELFATQHMLRDIDFDASFITSWAILFNKNEDHLPRIIRNYERRFWQLWKENFDLRDLAVETRNQLANMDNQVQELNLQICKKENQYKQELLYINNMLAENELSNQNKNQPIANHLIEQARQIRNELQELRARLIGKEEQVQDLQKQIQVIHDSGTWKIVQMIGRVRRIFGK